MVSSGKLESFIPEYIYLTVSAASSQNTRPYLSKIVRQNIRLLLILFTLRGPSRVSTMGGARYYVIFVDDFLRFTWIYLFIALSIRLSSGLQGFLYHDQDTVLKKDSHFSF